MKEKTQQEEIDFIKKSLKEGVSKRQIAKNLNKSTSYVDRIIYDINKPKDRFIEKEGFEYYAVCKKTNKEFMDFKNTSGILTTHIEKEYPGFIKPTNFKCRDLYKKTGFFWYEKDFFKITERKKENKEIKQCKYCEWNTFDLDNKSGWYTVHLKENHNKNIDEYISEFPEEKNIFKTYFNKIEFQKNLLLNENNYVECLICNKKFKMINFRHLQKEHNIKNVQEYLNLFPNAKTVSNVSSEKISLSSIKTNKTLVPTFRRTKPEIKFEELLIKLNINFLTQQYHKSFYYDFYLVDYDLFIEIDGVYWHGRDRKNCWEQRPINNIINDFKKSNPDIPLYRLIDTNSITYEKLNNINSIEELLLFLENERYDIGTHPLFNLNENDEILSKKYISKHKKYLIENKKLISNLFFLITNFYTKHENFLEEKIKKLLNSEEKFTINNLLN